MESADRDSVKQMVDALNRRLLSAHAEGRRVIVIVDEAQNLSAEVLEQVRLLTNLETATQKLLQIILIGQPELRELLDRTDLRQLAQRITGRYHLKPLSREETLQYVRHRLRVAGASGEIFTPAALREVHRLSSGIPRVINVCCDRALLGAYTREQRKTRRPRWCAGRPARSMGGGLRRAGCAGPWAHRCWPWPPRPRSPGCTTGSGKSPNARAALRHRGRARRIPGPQPSPTPRRRRPAAQAPPPAASPPPVSINALLAANEADTGDAAAFRRLLSLWGTAMVNDSDPCGQAQKAGLACLEQRGAWAQVRALNRPAILTLTDDKGQRHRVVLSALDEQFATLDLGDAAYACRSRSCRAIGSGNSPSSGNPRPRARGC